MDGSQQSWAWHENKSCRENRKMYSGKNKKFHSVEEY